MKGVRRDTKLEHDQFLQVLYQGHSVRTNQPRIGYDRKSMTMNLMIQSKNTLNGLMTKFYVSDDLVTLEPLKKNGQLL